LFIPGGDVLIIDVRDPANPVTLVNVNLSGISEAHNTFYEDGYLYIVDSFVNKVGIVDLTAFNADDPPPTITQAKWILSNVGSSFVHDITVRDGRLYACAWDSGLWIYDVTDVANTQPSFLGSAPGNNTHSCWPSPDGRFVVTGEERSGGGIKVFEITDNGGSLTLTLTDSLELPGEAFSVHNQFVIGYRVYNAWYEAGLQVFDIDPEDGTLSFVASYDTPNNWGVYPANGDALILLSDISSGLYLIEIDEGSINDDCNINGIDDSIDIEDGTSTDCNGNGIPDECEPILDHDCNANSIPDECDIADGTSDDYDLNGVPDECEDCNANGVSDACDISCATGDCLSDPDGCGTSLDLNGNGVPDECDTDEWPPTPEPMTWESPPAPVSTSELTMTATEASDPTPPVQYFFLYRGGGGAGGNSSGWQEATTYNDGDLDANTVQHYFVRARDGATPHNNGTYSDSAWAATHIETPTGLAAGEITSNAIEVTATGTFTNLDLSQSGLYFEWELAAGGPPVGNSGWVQMATVTAGSLAPETEYTFRVKARNQDAVETNSAEGSFTTLPGKALCKLMGDVNDDSVLNAKDISAYLRVKLGAPQAGDNAACADYQTGTLDGDTTLFVAGLLGM
jgi:hypothetical protein